MTEVERHWRSCLVRESSANRDYLTLPTNGWSQNPKLQESELWGNNSFVWASTVSSRLWDIRQRNLEKRTVIYQWGWHFQLFSASSNNLLGATDRELPKWQESYDPGMTVSMKEVEIGAEGGSHDDHRGWEFNRGIVRMVPSLNSYNASNIEWWTQEIEVGSHH